MSRVQDVAIVGSLRELALFPADFNWPLLNLRTGKIISNVK